MLLRDVWSLSILVSVNLGGRSPLNEVDVTSASPGTPPGAGSPEAALQEDVAG